MKRKHLALILVAALILALAIPSMASAAGNGTCGYRNMLKAHYGACHNFFNYIRLELMVRSANASIEALVRMAQATPYDDVEQLVRQTNRIAAEVIEYAQSIGASVECTYNTYFVDGQYVEIDPLRVVDLGGGSSHGKS